MAISIFLDVRPCGGENSNSAQSSFSGAVQVGHVGGERGSVSNDGTLHKPCGTAPPFTPKSPLGSFPKSGAPYIDSEKIRSPSYKDHKIGPLFLETPT